MKKAVLVHGNGGSDTDYFWFADTKKYLEANGYEVVWLLLPDTNDIPNLAETVEYLKQHAPLKDGDIAIGHSSGCPVILYWLQNTDVRLAQVVLVSGLYDEAVCNEYNRHMLPEEGFDFSAIKTKSDEFILINSDNDPWGCDDKQARPVAEKLGARFILAEGQGHMGSGSFNQPYREFPLLKDLLA